MQIVTVQARESGYVVAHQIECAHTSLTRLFGLLGRNRLDAGEGIWIRPSSGVHTFGMTFTIDVVGLDRNMRIVKLWRRLRPNRVTTISARVGSVLELAAGEIDAHSLSIGQSLRVVPQALSSRLRQPITS